jgi:hypothetical protein
MPRNKIGDLRDHLFEVIEALKEGDMEIDKAKAIAEVSQVIINSAKAENEFLRITKSTANGTGFIPVENENEIKKISG